MHEKKRLHKTIEKCGCQIKRRIKRTESCCDEQKKKLNTQEIVTVHRKKKSSNVRLKHSSIRRRHANETKKKLYTGSREKLKKKLKENSTHQSHQVKPERDRNNRHFFSRNINVFLCLLRIEGAVRLS